MVIAGNVNLSPLQRDQLAEALGNMRFRIAVVTGAPTAREHIALLRAQGHQHLIFGEDELEAALDYLNLQPSVRPLVTQRIRRLRSLLEEAHRSARMDDSIDAPAAATNPLRDFAKACGMSPREREVVFGLLSGDSRAQVASDLGVSEGSIHTYVSRACAKAGAASESELLRAIIRFLARSMSEKKLEAQN